MPYDPLRHHRRSIRLQGYDYAQPGFYYVTLTIQDRERILCSLVGGNIQLSRLGEIVREEWLRMQIVRPHIWLHDFVIMPDHIHGIIEICEERNGDLRRGELLFAPTRSFIDQVTPFRSPSATVGAIIRGFKGDSTKRINEERGTPDVRVWQRNYYEHIVRDERDLRRIQKYIVENQLRLKVLQMGSIINERSILDRT